MELNLTFYQYQCATETFDINGVPAREDDFGDQYDRDKERAEPYGCGDMQFTRIDSTPEVLEKYRITEAEYAIIAEKLEARLSFGKCGSCV